MISNFEKISLHSLYYIFFQNASPSGKYYRFTENKRNKGRTEKNKSLAKEKMIPKDFLYKKSFGTINDFINSRRFIDSG